MIGAELRLYSIEKVINCKKDRPKKKIQTRGIRMISYIISSSRSNSIAFDRDKKIFLFSCSTA